MQEHSTARTVMVVEDEEPIADAIAARLRSEGFRVEVAGDGRAALDLVRHARPDVVVLDLLLPGMDGLEVCRRLRADLATADLPVLMLTARDDETDLLVGLGVGADDYLTKPFSPRELVARLRALLRRAERQAAAAPLVQARGVRLDPAARRVWRDGAEVHLTATEFDLLACLGARPDVVHTREELLRRVWGSPGGHGGRTVDSHVQALRRKLGADVIRTVHGVGYALDAGARP